MKSSPTSKATIKGKSPAPEIDLIRPFKGLRPTPERIQEVAAPPYDVLDSEEARVLVGDNSWSFLHISKPEIDLPPGMDHTSPEAYAKAAENMNRMIEAGVLKQDETPCYYVYRLTMGDHVQTGLVVGASVSAYDNDRIRRHEFTRPDKEDDRVKQIQAVNSQTGPVLLAHQPQTEAKAIIEKITTSKTPEYDLVASDGIGHTLWVVDEEAYIQPLTEAICSLDRLYIADGHHRSAAASRAAAARRQANPEHGKGIYHSFLSVLFPSDQMLILDYNRVVRDLHGLTGEQFIAKIEERFTVEKTDGQAKPEKANNFGMYLEGQWYMLGLKEQLPGEDNPVARLDVSLLSDRLIEPILGISDPRRDYRIDFVGGMRGLGELEKKVDSGIMKVAFALYPTSMDDLISVADAGEIMPPKSTWFEPKLRDGLVSYILE